MTRKVLWCLLLSLALVLALFNFAWAQDPCDPDQTPPEIICPENITVQTGLGVCTASVEFEASATDNCDEEVAIRYYIGEEEITSPYDFPVGTTTVMAVAEDAAGNSINCFFVITVTNEYPPIAQNDSVNTFENTAAVINVLANDSDPDGDPLTIVSVGTPAHGTATTDGETITYTPDGHYVGSDSFTYTISDGCETSQATVNITVIIKGTERIYGWVFLDDGNGVREPSETAGLGGVLLELWQEGVMVATTDSSAPEGAYEFVEVPAGFYHVQVQVPLDYVATSPTRVGVEVVHGHWAQANFGVKRYETPMPTPTDTPTPTATPTPTNTPAATPTPTATPPKIDYWIFLPVLAKP